MRKSLETKGKLGSRTKFIFVTGGVVSSLGKGLVSASVGALMENRGLKVANIKLDPYLNVDAGTMNPLQHGEVYVTDDGAETDLDLGHYERFVSTPMSQLNNVTSGQVYHSVIQKERSGEYLGGTIQVIPHVTDEIKTRVMACAEGLDLLIVEVGGTVGDIESLPFLEAIRQLRLDLGSENSVSVHVTLLPYLAAAGELKTKPTQHSVQKMREIGIQPDVLVCRSEHEIEDGLLDKIAMFCSVSRDSVFVSTDVDTIYALPLLLADQGMDDKLSEILNIWSRAARLTPWEDLVDAVRNPQKTVTIAMVGKYVSLVESYKSINEALTHGGVTHYSAVKIIHVDAEEIEANGAESALGSVDGILVAPGFGSRGTLGKVLAVQYARDNRVPFFGICLGMQMAVIEFARNVCGLKGAASTEQDENTEHPVVHLMPDQRGVTDKGATMRLGAYSCVLEKGSKAYEIYKSDEIRERHRHRWEVNNDYREALEKGGLLLSGLSPDKRLVEIIEIADHPFFVGCQFHPEFKSRPLAPHPIFSTFVGAALAHQESK
ncbi:MAG: CTP synthase [Kofleriaceae bacterium]|nr:CTP synthase [Kofleriaceae bacterium]